MLQGKALGCLWSSNLMERLHPIPDLFQSVAHLAHLFSQASHLLANDTHALCHVLVHYHQLMAELPEEVCLLEMRV